VKGAAGRGVSAPDMTVQEASNILKPSVMQHNTAPLEEQ
jgi:hypothetical protein